MSNVFFTSDTHYGHANIASKKTSSWGRGYRHFNSVEEMNKALVKGINDIVGPYDTLYHLGDWSFGGIDNIWKFRSQIDCQNIHLIFGNHDQHIETPKPISLSGVDNTQDLFSSVGYYKEVKINGKMFVLSHYAHRIWHGSHKGWYHLYGHSHDSMDLSRSTGKLIEYGKSMDCGIDSAIRILGSPRPFALNEITAILDKRTIEFPDHHDPRTNT